MFRGPIKDKIIGKTNTLCRNAISITKNITLKNDLNTNDLENISVHMPITDENAQLKTGPPARAKAAFVLDFLSVPSTVIYAWQICALKSTENPTDIMT